MIIHRKILIAFTLVIGMIFFNSCKKKGCTDPAACNYNADASKDDGSCQGTTTWYQDSDGDGLGDPGSTTASCTQPIGYVDNSDDFVDAPLTQQSMGLVTKMTATWCGPCGSWGWTLWEDIIAEVGEKSVLMSVYSPTSSELNNTTAAQWGSDFDVQGYPNYCVNGKNRTAYSSSGGIYTSTTKTNAVNASDSTYSTSPVAAAVYSKVISGTTITVNTATQFFSAASGEYYLGVYVIEDGVIEDQSGDAGAGASHHVVLRGAMDGNAYGTLLVNGTAGTDVMENTFTMEMESDWVADNITIGLVIWNKVSGSYNFVNAYTKSGSH